MENDQATTSLNVPDLENGRLWYESQHIDPERMVFQVAYKRKDAMPTGFWVSFDSNLPDSLSTMARDITTGMLFFVNTATPGKTIIEAHSGAGNHAVITGDELWTTHNGATVTSARTSDLHIPVGGVTIGTLGALSGYYLNVAEAQILTIAHYRGTVAVYLDGTLYGRLTYPEAQYPFRRDASDNETPVNDRGYHYIVQAAGTYTADRTKWYELRIYGIALSKVDERSIWPDFNPWH